MKKILLGLSLLFLINCLKAQTYVPYTTSGFLIRVGMLDKDLIKSDTVDSWNDINYLLGGEYASDISYYDDAFINVGAQFVIKRGVSNTKMVRDAWSSFLINKLTGEKTQISFGEEGYRYYPAYGFNYGLNKTILNEGIFLYYVPFSSHAFFLDKQNNVLLPKVGSDTMGNRTNLYIIGKVNSQFLIATFTPIISKPNYYLEALDGSPKVKLSNPVSVVEDSFVEKWAPKKVFQIKDSIYLLVSSNLLITKFSVNKFSLLKEIKNPLPRSSNTYNVWTFTKDFLYYFNDTTKTFMKSRFDLTQNDFVERKVVFSNLNGSIDIDDEGKYIANLTSDTLFIYSIELEKLINKISVKGTQLKPALIVSPPNVYLQRIDKITDVKKEEALPTECKLAQNYPNPFNPSTTIQYSIPVETRHASSLQHVTLKVYDLLGREVTTLVNEYKQPGSYLETFHGTSLPSGVYFYRLQAGSFTDTKKLILMK